MKHATEHYNDVFFQNLYWLEAADYEEFRALIDKPHTVLLWAEVSPKTERMAFKSSQV